MMKLGFVIALCLSTLISNAAMARDCTALEGLLPEPMEGWELFNEAPAKVDETLASVQYSLILEKDGTGAFVDSNLAETVGIRIDTSPALVEPTKQMLQNGPMPGMLEVGPLGYPMMVGNNATIAGDFHISVDGNGPGTELYFINILTCAKAAGLAPAADYSEK